MEPYFKMSQTISRPVAEVFATVVRLDEFPRWSPRNPWAKKLTPGEIGEGTRFQLAIKGFGKVTNELREFEPNKRVMVAPLSGMLEGGHRWIFSDLGNGTTRIDHELELRPKGIFKLMGPMMRSTGARNVKETAAALQGHLEAAGQRLV
jgi:hypothetical protein